MQQVPQEKAPKNASFWTKSKCKPVSCGIVGANCPATKRRQTGIQGAPAREQQHAAPVAAAADAAAASAAEALQRTLQQPMQQHTGATIMEGIDENYYLDGDNRDIGNHGKCKGNHMDDGGSDTLNNGEANNGDFAGCNGQHSEDRAMEVECFARIGVEDVNTSEYAGDQPATKKARAGEGDNLGIVMHKMPEDAHAVAKDSMQIEIDRGGGHGDSQLGKNLAHYHGADDDGHVVTQRYGGDATNDAADNHDPESRPYDEGEVGRTIDNQVPEGLPERARAVNSGPCSGSEKDGALAEEDDPFGFAGMGFDDGEDVGDAMNGRRQQDEQRTHEGATQACPEDEGQPAVMSEEADGRAHVGLRGGEAEPEADAADGKLTARERRKRMLEQMAEVRKRQRAETQAVTAAWAGITAAITPTEYMSIPMVNGPPPFEVHPTHDLVLCGGFAGCVRCGRVAGYHGHNRFAIECRGHCPAGRVRPVRRLVKGLHPYSKGCGHAAPSWPDGVDNPTPRRHRPAR